MTPRGKKIVFLSIIGALAPIGLWIVHNTFFTRGPEPRLRTPRDDDLIDDGVVGDGA